MLRQQDNGCRRHTVDVLLEHFHAHPALVVDFFQCREDRTEVDVAHAGAEQVGIVGVEVD